MPGPSAFIPAHDQGLVHLRARPQCHIISHGETALVAGADGELIATEEHGLFVRETRVLSHHALRVGGRRLIPVSRSPVRQDQWHSYYLVAPRGKTGAPQARAGDAAKAGLELLLVRTVGEGLHEDVHLTNHADDDVEVMLELRADGDFVGQDEAGQPESPRGRLVRAIADTNATVDRRWRYRAQRKDPGDGVTRTLDMTLQLRVDQAPEPADDARQVRFRIRLPARGAWHACLHWEVSVDGDALPPPPCPGGDSAALRERIHPAWIDESLVANDGRRSTHGLQIDVVGLLARAQRDLHALRLPRFDAGGAWTVAAGAPAYLALFGRDMLTTGWQSALLGTQILDRSLGVMAETQGTRRDDWRDEAPGRMLHEARETPEARLNERPTGRYYGSLTSSGLYPFALAQLWDWTGDRARVTPMIEPALRALRWLDNEAQQVPGPFYAVRTRSSKGLDNQTWKDSSESIVDLEGSIVPQPVATCEEQAIVYATKQSFAGMLEDLGRLDEARTLRREADELKRRFNEHFWLEETGFLAMALDPKGRAIASIGSNALRCLASGILEPAIARKVAERAFAPDMFSGWGIRTLSSEHAAYNPHGYHVGAIWPVEHGPFALGLRRYGETERCHRLCLAQFQLADLCEGRRLPECVSGHGRDALHPFPAVYVSANAPQAWSASTPIVLVQALLGIRAQAGHTLWLDPCLPEWLPELRLHGLRVGSAAVDVHFLRDADGKTHFDVLDGSENLQVRRGVPDDP